MHICELVGVADSFGLDLQDGELVDQLPGRDLDLNRSFERLWHDVELGAAREPLEFLNSIKGLWTTIVPMARPADGRWRAGGPRPGLRLGEIQKIGAG